MRIRFVLPPPLLCDNCQAQAFWHVVNDKHGQTSTIGYYCKTCVPQDTVTEAQMDAFYRKQARS